MAGTKAARMPSMIYGTAWKKDRTQDLVKRALLAGFRGVDTAAQPKHYQEHLAGQGIRDALKDMPGITRQDLYIQTKFTSIDGQDPRRMPYDASAAVTDQVKASVASSIANLYHEQDSSGKPSEDNYLDCLVLHSPLRTVDATHQAWQTMESFVPHPVRTLGISNVYDAQLLELICSDEFSRIKPLVVQNRFYGGNGYDREVRAYCTVHGIAYQSFWTLSGNPDLLKHKVVRRLANEAKVTAEVALYGLVQALSVNVSILNGTTNNQRMKEDLEGLQSILKFRDAHPSLWRELHSEFQALVDNGQT